MGIFDEVLDSSPHIARDELLSVQQRRYATAIHSVVRQ
jgi:hypothetical protein